jgi:hypothetical protein
MERRSPGSKARATSTTTIAASQPNRHRYIDLSVFPGRCTECSYHVEAQGHRDGCGQTAPITPERDERDFLQRIERRQ